MQPAWAGHDPTHEGGKAGPGIQIPGHLCPIDIPNPYINCLSSPNILLQYLVNFLTSPAPLRTHLGKNIFNSLKNIERVA